MTNKHKYLKRTEAAEYVRNELGIPCSVGYLAKLASIGGGPVFHKVHTRLAVYSIDELERWAKTRLSPPITRSCEAQVPQAA